MLNVLCNEICLLFGGHFCNRFKDCLVEKYSGRHFCNLQTDAVRKIVFIFGLVNTNFLTHTHTKYCLLILATDLEDRHNSVDISIDSEVKVKLRVVTKRGINKTDEQHIINKN